MLDFLLNIFKKEFQLQNISIITSNLHDIVQLLEEAYVNDPKAKNDAIDVVCKLLQQFKT